MRLIWLLTCFMLRSAAQTVYYPASYNDLGCWADKSDRAIQIREGDPILTHINSYQDRIRAIEKCAQVAHNNGDEVFSVQGWANYGQPNVFKQPSKITPYSCYVERK